MKKKPAKRAAGSAPKRTPKRSTASGAKIGAKTGAKTGANKRSPNPAGYSGTPLPKKLMIRDGDIVSLVDAPDGFEKTLGPLPTGAVLRRDARGTRNVTIWFVQARRDLESGLASLAKVVGEGKLWLAWPKKASGVVTDVTEEVVRQAGLARGLVDYKVCAIDATWSGLLFARRR